MTFQMPILKPVRIPTKNLGWFTGLHKWFTAKRVWRVHQDWYFTCPDIGFICVIPQGFVFDGASIPRPLWWFLSPTGIMLIPGLVHDFAYRYDFLLAFRAGKKVPIRVNFGKVYWDMVFRELAREVNDVLLLHWVVWVCVAGGGYFAWKKNRKLNNTKEAYWKVSQ